jgi:uncharacterized protein involved in exopolysaccharide biosynthesis
MPGPVTEAPQSQATLEQRLQVIDAANLPETPIRPNREAFMAWGFGLGFVLALSMYVAWKHPAWALRTICFGAVGCALGCAVSFVIPNKYISTATVQFTPREFVPEAEMAAWTIGKQQEFLSLAQQPSLDVYGKETAHAPEVAVRPIASGLVTGGSAAPAFAISFSYFDRVKAQAQVNAFVTRLLSRNDAGEQEDGGAWSAQTIEVLDNANLPEDAVSPDRTMFASVGLGVGVLTGFLFSGAAQWRVGRS